MATQSDSTEKSKTIEDQEIKELEEDEEETEEPEQEEDDDSIRSSLPSWQDLELKHRIMVIAAVLLLCYVGYRLSVLLSLLLATAISLIGLFKWFSTTNLSVEITVFLAKFFPPAAWPVIDCKATPECAWSKAFRENWKVIYQEYLDFEQEYNYCPEMDDVYPNGSITNWDRKWPTVNLRCYGLDTQISKYFPKTMKLVNESDTWLSHVMFSILKPNKYIPRHRGPYRGVFRYHLHLEIPEHKNPAEQLYLAVWPETSSADFWDPANVPDGEPTLCTWKDGDDFLFDDTCVHEVINFTGKRRIILFMDVERYDISFFSKLIHRVFMSAAKYLPAVQNCKAVQDDYLKKYVDEKTNQPMRYGPAGSSAASQIDYNLNTTVSPSNSWMWYNTAPEILPYKKARVVIENQKKRNGETAKPKST
eukprot:CAMPEP_0197029260 /NCGR_PEP_ID=MMETSP1384-20130603/8749_1 /TAXON_ID=29189 /ORGANISM="Ammonia sp." /LENGTH=419 /DNA_ID=CAMNT_0042458393 /DNA_START=71 /DNA_END=1330 /DNA_ORIENTATION=+